MTDNATTPAKVEGMSPIEAAIDDDTKTSARGGIGWLGLAVAILFGIVYAYFLWVAISNFVSVPGEYRALGFDPGAVPGILAIGIAVPPVVFAAAFLVARRQKILGKAVVFLVGLTVTAGLGLSVMALASAIGPT